VRVDADGVLAFRGPNACLGLWDGGRLVALPPDRWARTGDLARAEADGTFTYEGRASARFKLANGRWVSADAAERAVRARFPAVGEALLSTPAGRALVLACSPAAGRGPGDLPRPADVAPVLAGALGMPLGALGGAPGGGGRALRVVAVAPDAWARTAKGELDRRHPTGAPGRPSDRSTTFTQTDRVTVE
jgi:acyl-CoA synthetase (AMP-forming)/AMP-acid ligase II